MLAAAWAGRRQAEGLLVLVLVLPPERNIGALAKEGAWDEAAEP